MSDIPDALGAALKDAMRARDKPRLLALRGILTEFKNAGIEARTGEGDAADNPLDLLDDAACVRILQKIAKRRRDAADTFAKAGRQDLADADFAEIEVIQEFLPAGLSSDEVEALVQEAIAEVGADSAAAMGAVMKAVQPKIAGRADGRMVADTVKRLLS